MNSISDFLIIFYSSALVLLTIWNLQYPNENLDILLVFGSIAVLVASITVSSQKYLERSLAIRNCYIKLDELYSKVKRAEKDNNIDLIQELESEYSATIQNVENHSDYDYLCLRFGLRNSKETTLPEFRKSDYAQYVLERVWRTLLVLFYFVFPLLIAILWNLYI
jgi:hypothetical protein